MHQRILIKNKNDAVPQHHVDIDKVFSLGKLNIKLNYKHEQETIKNEVRNFTLYRVGIT